MADGLHLDPRLLLSFVTIYEEGNVTRAAEKIGLTQQGLSGALARLRDILDDPLFVRQGHGVAPTPRAEEAYPRILQALAALDHVLDYRDFDPAEAKGSFRIAAADYAMATVVLPLARELPDIAPGLDLLVQSYHGEFDAASERQNSVDLIVTVHEFMPPHLRTMTLFSDRYVLAMRHDHPLARRQVSLDAFCEAEHLLVSPNKASVSGVSDAALTRLGRSRRIRLVIPAFALAPKMLSETNLVAVLPERLVRDFQDTLVTQPPPFDLEPFDVMVGWQDRHEHAPMHQWVRKSLNNYAGR